MSSPYTQEDRRVLLGLARGAIRRGVGKPHPEPPTDLSPALRETKACFVTLHLHGELRGCIGTLQAREPLFQAVPRNARAAAFEDSRFLPVTAEEEPDLDLEISVLSEPRPLDAKGPEAILRALRPGVDGVLLRGRGCQATFLPQVWAQLPGPEDFLDHLSRKAGRPGLWRNPEAELLTYHVTILEE